MNFPGGDGCRSAVQTTHRLLDLNPERIAELILVQDGIAGLLSAAALRRLSIVGLEEGTAVGLELAGRFPGLSPVSVARALGVRVHASEQSPWIGPLLRYADYGAQPPEIRLFNPAIAWLDQVIDAAEIRDRCTLHATYSVFVAHELYHHIDAIGPQRPLSERHAVSRWRLGKWRVRVPALAVAEIAAGACAQALLGLSHHPALLDLMAQAWAGWGCGDSSLAAPDASS